jgi:hypothetical protein
MIDSAQHCLDQLAEYRRLMKSAENEAEAHALQQICRTWTALAGQIDRYNALLRNRRSCSRVGPQEQGLS